MAKKIVAQKFGGTSVATAESRQLVVNHIRRAISDGYSPVVVVSAMGRRGAPYATDTLLDFIHAQGEPVAGRDEDLIFHCGEIISVAVVSHLLKLSGLPALGLTGGQAQIYTDGRYRRGKIVRLDPSRLLRHVENGEIPVVTGGQGVTAEEGEVNILGRGASDTSGVAVGVAVGAEKVEIYTDVPGVAIADPRVVPGARFLEVIGYRKMYEIGVYGAKVMHPGAVLVGQQGNIPIVCRSTFVDGPGTLITETQDEPPLVGIPSMGPVDLFTLSAGSLKDAREKEELYVRFGAVAIKDEKDEKTIVAVAPGWREELADSLVSKGIHPEKVVSDKSLVSLVGALEFIAQSFSRVELKLAELGVKDFIREKAEIRSTFVVPYSQASRLVETLYAEFVE